jgi:hypothetical protein
MNSKEIVKKDLIRRKINEYFSKHPKAKSVIINSGIDSFKTIWRVVKESNNFVVTEVNTKREKFILEAPIPVGGQRPAPGAVPLSTVSKPGQAMPGTIGSSETLELVKSGMLKVTSSVIEKLFAPLLIPKDPTAKRQIKLTWDILNKATNKDQASASFLAMMQNLMNTPSWLAASKKNNGTKLQEVDKETSIEDMPQDEDQPTDAIGLDQAKKVEPVEKSVEKSQEEMVMQKSLEGKPIEQVSLEHRKDGVDLIIKTVGVDIPSKFSFFKDGKIIFHHKDRPYIIKRQ